MADLDGFDKAAIVDRNNSDQWGSLNVAESPAFRLPVIPDAPAAREHATPEEQLLARAILVAEMLHRQGIAVGADELFREDHGIPLKVWRELVQSEMFAHALEARGIPPASLTGLTPQMLSVLELYLQMTGKSHAQRLRAAGINDRIWTSWMRLPAFAAFINGGAELRLVDNVPAAIDQIVQQAQAGQRWAIELNLEMTGRHDRRQQQVSTQELLMTVFMALDDAGVSGELLAKIGDSIRRRMGAPEGAPVIQLPAARAPEPEG